MTTLVFFYGTLMSGFKRPGRARLDPKLEPEGRGWIPAALFDLGIYPAAIPAADSRRDDLPHSRAHQLPQVVRLGPGRRDDARQLLRYPLLVGSQDFCTGGRRLFC